MRGDDEDGDGTDAFFDQVVDDLERQRILERTGRIAAEIEIDLEAKGPLGLYAESRRVEAAVALRRLTGIDPRDSVGIAEAQAAVREYLRVFEWVGGWIEQAAQAEEIIKREYTGSSDDDQGE